MRQILLGALTAVTLATATGFGFIQSGGIDFAADSPHSPLTTKVIAWAREQSVAKQAQKVIPPGDLASEERVRRGAGNYEGMCVSCHLSPGVEDSELRKGLYPLPPNLSLDGAPTEEAGADARRFWIIKHGIKGSGMSAWAKGGMDDEAIWDLTAFIKVLPGLSATGYQKAVAASDGHSHGGTESPRPGESAARPHDYQGHSHAHDRRKHSHQDRLMRLNAPHAPRAAPRPPQ